MKKIISGILVLLLMGSCLTESKIKRNCDRFAKVCGTAMSSSTIYKDTTIYLKDTIEVPLPPDTVRIGGDVQIINGVANFKPVYLEGNLIALSVEIKNNRLEVKSYLRKKSISTPINMTINLKSAIRETTVNKVAPVKYIPDFYKWCMWIVILQLIVFLLFILKKFNVFNIATILGKILK